MLIEIPDTLTKKAKISQEDILLSIALMLFADERITLAQAAHLAGLHQMQFQKELAKRKIPIHYGEEDYRRDLLTISKMKTL